MLDSDMKVEEISRIFYIRSMLINRAKRRVHLTNQTNHLIHFLSDQVVQLEIQKESWKHREEHVSLKISKLYPLQKVFVEVAKQAKRAEWVTTLKQKGQEQHLINQAKSEMRQLYSHHETIYYIFEKFKIMARILCINIQNIISTLIKDFE